MKQRPIHHVPIAVWVLFALALLAQLVWHERQYQPTYQPLTTPLPASVYSLATLGDPILAARLLDLWLQAHDNQPGVSVPFRELDYVRLVQWLDLSLQLDPQDNYPLLVASHVYSQVNDSRRVRIMLDFVAEKTLEQPQTRWRWLAHAAIKAQHELNDKPLALKYANTLAELAGVEVPYWARDLRILILEDMGEKEAAKILIGGLLAQGEISDAAEIRFLEQRLAALD
jgi:hypothetical protein